MYKVYIYTYDNNSLGLHDFDTSMDVLILSSEYSWWSPFGGIANKVLRYKVL